MLPGHTLAFHPIPPCVDAETITHKVLPCLLDMGESMLIAGADVNLVELLLRRVGHAYGAYKMNVLVITASIIVTMTLPDRREYTQTRRIENPGETDFEKLEALTQLCMDCYKDPLPPDELRARFEQIRTKPFPATSLYIGGIIAASSFAVFFGGSWVDAVMTAVFSIVICLLLTYLKPITPNLIVFNFMACALVGLMIGGVAHLMPQMSVDMVTIGVIILLVPGVAMTNATRDMISGDTISGVMRFIESLLLATAIALGFMASLWVAGLSTGEFASTAAPLISLAACVPAAFGFALFFNVRRSLLALATIGGVCTWGIYLVMNEYVIHDAFMPTFIAAIFAAVLSQVVSKQLKVPVSVVFITSVIPLIPGRALYFTMKCALLGSWTQCGEFALLTLQPVLGIALGISFVWAIARTWSNFCLHRARATNTMDAGQKADS